LIGFPATVLVSSLLLRLLLVRTAFLRHAGLLRLTWFPWFALFPGLSLRLTLFLARFLRLTRLLWLTRLLRLTWFSWFAGLARLLLLFYAGFLRLALRLRLSLVGSGFLWGLLSFGLLPLFHSGLLRRLRLSFAPGWLGLARHLVCSAPTGIFLRLGFRVALQVVFQGFQAGIQLAVLFFQIPQADHDTAHSIKSKACDQEG
jgi:hypothetical protein